MSDEKIIPFPGSDDTDDAIVQPTYFPPDQLSQRRFAHAAIQSTRDILMTAIGIELPQDTQNPVKDVLEKLALGFVYSEEKHDEIIGRITPQGVDTMGLKISIPIYVPSKEFNRVFGNQLQADALTVLHYYDYVLQRETMAFVIETQREQQLLEFIRSTTTDTFVRPVNQTNLALIGNNMLGSYLGHLREQRLGRSGGDNMLRDVTMARYELHGAISLRPPLVA